MFLLDPIKRIPVLHRGTLERYLAESRNLGNSAYIRGLRATKSILKEQGCTQPLNYELHIPLPMTKTGVLLAHKVGVSGRARKADALQIRSLYGNMYSIGGRAAQDVKVFSIAKPWTPSTFLSTSDAMWPRHPAAQYVAVMFKQPGPYERSV